MAVATFDGPTKTITVLHQGTVTEVTAAAIYSEWKDWVLAHNAQYEPAFASSVGGNPLGGGVSLSGYFFVNNDAGWRLAPEPGFDYEVRITGDLYPADADTATYPWLDSSAGQTVLVTFDRSAASRVVVSSGSVADIQDAVWDAPLSAHVDAGSAGKRQGDIKPTAWGL